MLAEGAWGAAGAPDLNPNPENSKAAMMRPFKGRFSERMIGPPNNLVVQVELICRTRIEVYACVDVCDELAAAMKIAMYSIESVLSFNEILLNPPGRVQLEAVHNPYR
jgi:hypothetical protein